MDFGWTMEHDGCTDEAKPRLCIRRVPSSIQNPSPNWLVSSKRNPIWEYNDTGIEGVTCLPLHPCHYALKWGFSYYYLPFKNILGVHSNKWFWQWLLQFSALNIIYKSKASDFWRRSWHWFFGGLFVLKKTSDFNFQRSLHKRCVSAIKIASNERTSLATNRLPIKYKLTRGDKRQAPGITGALVRSEIVSSSWAASLSRGRGFWRNPVLELYLEEGLFKTAFCANTTYTVSKLSLNTITAYSDVMHDWNKTNNSVVRLAHRPSNLTFVVASTQVRWSEWSSWLVLNLVWRQIRFVSLLYPRLRWNPFHFFLIGTRPFNIFCRLTGIVWPINPV